MQSLLYAMDASFDIICTMDKLATRGQGCLEKTKMHFMTSACAASNSIQMYSQHLVFACPTNHKAC